MKVKSDNEILSEEDRQIELNKIETSTGATWLKKGTDVRVIQTIREPPWSFFSVVETMDAPKIGCIVYTGRLEMGLFEWIKWKLNF